MKKVVILIIILSSVFSRAQITLENTYINATAAGPSSITAGFLTLVHLNSAGYKYAVKTLTNITLYNLNHTVYQTIPTPTVPTLACTYCALNIWFIEHLHAIRRFRLTAIRSRLPPAQGGGSK